MARSRAREERRSYARTVAVLFAVYFVGNMLWFAIVERVPNAIAWLAGTVAVAAAVIVVRRWLAARSCICRLGIDNATLDDEGFTGAVVLVHGTFARHASWLQPGSAVRRELHDETAGSVRILTHCWSGANVHAHRQRAARDLAERVRGFAAQTPAPVVLLGHSHGGNVAMMAAGLSRGAVSAVATLATPFLHFSDRHLPRHRLVPMGMLVVGVIGLALVRLGLLPATTAGAAIAARLHFVSLTVVAASLVVWWVAERRHVTESVPAAVPTPDEAATVAVVTFVAAMLFAAPADLTGARWHDLLLLLLSALLLVVLGHGLARARPAFAPRAGWSRSARADRWAATREALNAGVDGDLPVLSVTGLADEAAAALVTMQFSTIVAGVVQRAVASAVRLLPLPFVVISTLGWLISAGELGTGAPGDLEQAGYGELRNRGYGPLVAFGVALSRQAAAELGPWIGGAATVIGVVALAAVTTRTLGLAAAGWDVPGLARVGRPVVTQTPLGGARAEVVDLGDTGPGLQHSRVYAGTTGVGRWVAQVVADLEGDAGGSDVGSQLSAAQAFCGCTSGEAAALVRGADAGMACCAAALERCAPTLAR